MVITCTIRALLKKKMNDQKISFSLGKVLCLRPFSVTYPPDKASQNLPLQVVSEYKAII